jgi:protein-S-isoprenylcysteine O-methyltransferase Ste14
MARHSIPTWASNIPVPEAHLAGLAAGVVVHRLVPWRLPLARSPRLLIGAGLLAAGIGVIVLSLRAAGDAHLARAGRLVVTGPYARSRNPMYVGWWLVHGGVGVATGSAWVLAALPPVACSIHRSVRREEAVLDQRFGEEFERYRATVPRYLPRPGRP